MEIDDSHAYDAPLPAVVEMYGDPDAAVARYEGMGHRDVEVLGCTRTDTSMEVRTRRVVDVALPGFARKVLRPTNTIVQTDTWERDGDVWNGRVAIEVDAPTDLSSTMRLSPDGDRTLLEVSIRLDVKVPVVGGRIARWAGENDLRTTMEAEFAAGDAWLAEHA